MNNRNVGNDRCISSTVLSHSYKSKGPTKLEKHIGEKLFLRRLYTGSRLIQVGYIYIGFFNNTYSGSVEKLSKNSGITQQFILSVAYED